MPNAEHTLSGVSLFAKLREAERRQIETQFRWHTYEPQQQIIDRESDSRDVFFIARGKARIIYYSPSGREVSLEDIGDGGFFGELAAIDGRPRSASVIAVTRAIVASLAPELFVKLVTTNPELAHALMKRLAAMIRQSSERIFDLSTLRAQSRVYGELLRLVGNKLRADNTAVIDPAPVHADIASRVSTTRETVARALSDLARHNVVKRDKHALVILDVEKLSDLAEDYGED